MTDNANLKTPLSISSLEDLSRHEAEILKRILEYPNNMGGNLFAVHPFMLLADVGVAIAEEVKQELIVRFPSFATLSEVPYLTLKNSEIKQGIRISLNGLFDQKGAPQ